jgi:hypothetical protein
MRSAAVAARIPEQISEAVAYRRRAESINRANEQNAVIAAEAGPGLARARAGAHEVEEPDPFAGTAPRKKEWSDA